MSWASGKRLLIIGIVLAVALIIAGAAAYLTLHKAPSCTDGTMNQGESGVDCGGPCARQCTADVKAPIISFAVPLLVSPGRTDFIAYVQNQNRDAAAKGARFTIEFRDASGALLGTKQGTADLPPAGVVPVYIPNAYTGATIATQAFLTFNDSLLWFKYDDARVIPIISAKPPAGSGNAPRVVALVQNTSVIVLPPTKLIATLFDADGNVVAASQTVTPSIPAQGSVEATFTWNAAFSAPVARIDVRPIVPL